MRKQFLAASLMLLLISAVAMAANTGSGRSVKNWPGDQHRKPQSDVVRGVITEISPGSITVQSRHGIATLLITEQTKFKVDGQPATIANIEQGDIVEVKYAHSTNGNILAVAVVVPMPRYVGKITEITNIGFILTTKNPNQIWQVLITPGTQVFIRDRVASTMDLQPGFTAIVRGDVNGNTITAELIRIRPEVIKGVVDQINGDQIIVTTVKQRTFTVTATDTTEVLIRPRVGPNRKGSLADVQAGMAVDIAGPITGEGFMTAWVIDLLVARDSTPPARTPANRKHK